MQTTVQKNMPAPRKLLLVEDDDFLRDMLYTKLVKTGYEVFLAVDGTTVLDAAKEHQPELILLDIVMPIKDGFEALEELKADEATKHIPVVMLSNLSQRDDVDRATAAGAVDFMIKSNYSPKEIVLKIEALLAEPK